MSHQTCYGSDREARQYPGLQRRPNPPHPPPLCRPAGLSACRRISQACIQAFPGWAGGIWAGCDQLDPSRASGGCSRCCLGSTRRCARARPSVDQRSSSPWRTKFPHPPSHRFHPPADCMQADKGGAPNIRTGFRVGLRLMRVKGGHPLSVRSKNRPRRPRNLPPGAGSQPKKPRFSRNEVGAG